MNPPAAGSILDLGVQTLERDFTPLYAVPDNEDYIRRGTELSARIRGTLRCNLDVPYGDTPLQKLDIFQSGFDAAPIVVFIHGGYWYSLDKSDYSYVAGPLVANGADAVLINYDLCPAVTLDVVVGQCMKALAWVYRNLATASAQPRRLFVSGNSAGAHLAAMALARDWSADQLPEILSGAFCVTGIYDVQPVPLIKANELIGLTMDVARRNSPMFMRPSTRSPVLVAVGGDETEGWIRQSRDYTAMLRRHDVPAELMVVPGKNHFSIAESLGDPDSVLVGAIASRLHASP